MREKILVVEDEEAITDILTHYLKKEGYEVFEAECGKRALELINDKKFDLVLLDLMLPDISGYDVCRSISSKYKIPIIMLTAKNDIVDKILGLELGADDYITKPFDIREVLVRIKVALRRMEGLITVEKIKEETIKLPYNIEIFINSREVYKNESAVRLKPKEFELLLILAENRKVVFTRDKLLEKVWGFDFEGESRTVDVHIQRIRKKLGVEKDDALIETVFGLGYKML
ncbi:response regulator transcription factor [Clostridium peptidivorans]|uniref:response regulator transcription factor n=1 Tax=Clostridium peptidivorans TaxID=100174 RepID=UPI000BE46760|nr:response regulator transcription factor [Clostridium peptidivorans]